MRAVQQQLNFRLDTLSDEELYKRMRGELNDRIQDQIHEAVTGRAIKVINASPKKRNRKTKTQKKLERLNRDKELVI